MSNKKLSIIIPVYNSQEYLVKCVDSVLGQTYTNFDLILVDDASTDESGKICDRYKQIDSRVIVIHHESNKGLSCTREDGYKIANTQWVSFVDNDDFIAPGMYERLMDKCEEGDIICIRGEDKSSHEIEVADWMTDEHSKKVYTGKEACNNIYSKKIEFGCVGPIWGKILRKELVDKVLEKVYIYKNELNWVYFEDVLFMPMLFYYANKVFFDDKLMYMHRHIRNNLSSTLQPKEYHYQSMKANTYVLAFFQEHQLQKAYETYLIDSFLGMQGVWYKVWKNETNESKKKQYNADIDSFWLENIPMLSSIKNKNLTFLLKKFSIKLFYTNKYFWGYTVGTFYFSILRKILY